jgi:hypothetical protein
MQYVIKDLIGQMIDTLQKDSAFADVNVRRHVGEVNILMFQNPAYWSGMIEKIPFVLIKYNGRSSVNQPSARKNVWLHELEFGVYVGTKSMALDNKEEAGVEAEVLLAKIFDLWTGKMFYSTQTFASPITYMSGAQITTSGFNQFRCLEEAGGQCERLIMSLPEVVLYETKYTCRLLAHT